MLTKYDSLRNASVSWKLCLREQNNDEAVCMISIIISIKSSTAALTTPSNKWDLARLEEK